MSRKLLVLGIIMQIVLPVTLYSQTRSAFTGDREKFHAELRTFMGPNLNEEQIHNLDAFLVKWDSAVYNSDNMVSIMDISSQLSSRYMRPVPHFDSFIRTLNYFVEFKHDEAFIESWLRGLSELAFSPRYTNENIYMFLKNSSSMIRNNVLYESGTVTWKVKNSELEFRHDTVFYVSVKNATLTCYSQKDSTEIYNVTGDYYPEFQLFKGAEGKVTWEKAGYAVNNVYAEIKNFRLNTARNNYTADSARFIHSSYFTSPVYGVLSDQAAGFSSKQKATFPKFTTYAGKFLIKDLYKGIDYEGGLTFEGAGVKGTGTTYTSAKISLRRNDTLYMKIASREFIFSQNGINSLETSLTLYLDKDSIYHSDLGFTYLADTRQVNLFRTNNPVSGSPYFSSFHDVDMYFDYLSWNMNESQIHLSRARGASIGQARFESSSFFYSDYFLKLMGMDEYHPLNRLVKFAEWYYSDSFPVSEFAKWLNRPQEYVTGLCIDLANKGFIFYDREINEVTIKQKTRDYLDFFAKRRDYDVLSISSETRGSVDNASLDLRNFRLTINGVQNVFLSDSQMVSIHPSNRQIVLGKNRDMMFDGVVQAGLFTIYGHNFSFNYDTFKIRLQKIDSIKIAVETGERDIQGRPLIKDVDNLIQLATAELYIDRPDNKSGLKSLGQYPIINTLTYSYIFYDKLPGLEGVYPQKDFYFRLDPFTYENIDHYSSEDLNLRGEFIGGNILKPIRQYLTIQEDNSLGFNMNTTEKGLEVYDGKGVLFENLTMNNKGLTARGRLNHLASQTISDDFKFYPDSMLAHASSFRINDNTSGIFPILNSEEVDIKWLIPEDKWLATTTEGKNFDMFENNTALKGTISMTPKRLEGSGVIDMSDSRITSNLFTFTSNSIMADTADYNIKSRTTNGYSFIAENANTNINFDEKLARFSLNTDSSLVKFPEIQYICTMTNFVYNLDTRILDMEQKGKSQSPLLTAEELVRVNRGNLNEPTFFSTNNLSDTISFSSWKANYFPDKEIIIAENINYIPIADALIQPENGRITINRRASIEELQNATVAVNNKHLLHNAAINIESSKRYTGSAIYDYVDENKEIQQITFPELTVDTLTTSAKGHISASQKFMLSPAFSFEGDVMLNARADRLTFTGSAGIVNDCEKIKSINIKFKSPIDPANIMIPVGDKPRDLNDNPVFSGSFISADSLQIYPAFLSEQKSWADIGMVTASGFLYYDKLKSTYIIAPEDKIADRSMAGDMVTLDRNNCVITGEGEINFGAKYDLFKMASAGNITHLIDSGKVTIQAMLGLDFYFSPEALNIMAEELRLVPSLKQVNLNSEFNNKGMKDLFGYSAAARISEEMSLFGTSRNMPKEYTYELFLNDVTLQWNESTSSFRSSGKIGVGFVGTQPLNLYLDGYIEIQRRRSGDMIDVYLKANDATWYYFSYFRGVMMTQAANGSYNNLISETKASARKHPESSVRVPYSYMIAVEDRLSRFLRRMTSNEALDDDTSVR